MHAIWSSANVFAITFLSVYTYLSTAYGSQPPTPRETRTLKSGNSPIIYVNLLHRCRLKTVEQLTRIQHT